jgi:polyferredoxin
MRRKGLSRFGLLLFVLGFTLFNGIKFFEQYSLDQQLLSSLFKSETLPYAKESLAELQNSSDISFDNSLSFTKAIEDLLGNIDKKITQDFGISESQVDQILKTHPDQNITFSIDKAIKAFESNSERAQAFKDNASWLKGKNYPDKNALKKELELGINSANQALLGNRGIGRNNYDNYLLSANLLALSGPVENYNVYILGLLMFICLSGAILSYVVYWRKEPGIKNDSVYHSSNKNRGWIGIIIGTYLITFYIVLYFFPHHLAPWINLVDPVSKFLNGGKSSQWFLYGFLYTLCIAVMGLRMLGRYRHSPYQITRTASVIFFQVVFAFLLPQVMTLLNQPSQDLKNIWPLDYSFFFNYHLDQLIESGGFGLFLLFWGIALIIIAVPVLTYFYGKRWYCSWVCGCGGLAETLGDPYRHLSDKSTQAWQIERIIIHSVLVFVVVMTAMVLYSYLFGDIYFGVSRVIMFIVPLLAIGGLVFYHRKKYPAMNPAKIYRLAGIFVLLLCGYQLYQIVGNGSWTADITSYSTREVYGFSIGAVFAGVVGTGFYPLMGNRVWCRFGCPLAAYLGIVQRFKSRFRITTNGGQCISCGNCSTYCEMGIDVRWYAQRQQDIVRSSCVGCGICSAVCPRGVLNLENSSAPRNI